MERLVELLKGIGASEELTKAFCEELERYSTSLKSKFEGEYTQKIERAKAVCIEEVNSEKARLAKRVKTFLESKATTIEQAAASKRAIEESESSARLKKAKAILEGVEIKDGGVTSQELQDAQKKIVRLEQMLSVQKEEKNLAISKANTANEIASKALRENRQLTEKLATNTKTLEEGYCHDHKLPFPANGKCAKCGGKSEGGKADEPKKEEKMDEAKKPAPARLDESRKVPTGAASTRRTMTESQVKTPGSTGGNVPPVTEIQKIAEGLE